MKISIIVPIYNASKFLSECLYSIQKQSYTDFEVLCIDDGSIDNSADIALNFTKIDKRFKLFQQSNSGVSVARNAGIRYAKGEYICFVDADDKIAPNYLTFLYNFSKKGDFAICGFTKNIKKLGKKGGKNVRHSTKEFINKVLEESIEHPNLWAMMFKADVIKSNSIEFYPGCIRNEDTEFYMKYLVHEEGNVVCIDYKGYFYRDNPNSAMHVTNRNAFTSFEASERIGKYLADNGFYMEYNKMLFCSIQSYSVGLARQKNVELFDELHTLYNVKEVMQIMLKHPRLIRRIVALVYLIFGKRLYYKVLGNLSI